MVSPLVGNLCFQMDSRYQYQAEELLCGVLNNLQLSSNVEEKLFCRSRTTHWLSIFYKKNGKLSKAKQMSTKWLEFYSQYQQTDSDEVRVMKDIQLVKPGLICDIIGAFDRLNFNY